MAEERVDELGIQLSGDESRMSWREIRREAEVVELMRRARDKRRGERETYEDWDEYDPVLRWHCRF